MIQLATDPTASRTSYGPQGDDGKAQAASPQRGRSGHTWPFISRQPIRPARQEGQKPTPSDSGS
jgi:hypothetical protein